MARKRILPNPENASIHDLREAGRVGTFETSIRCTAIQMLITEISRESVCKALEVSNRALQKWIKLFNNKGIDGLIAIKRKGCPRKIQPENIESILDDLDHPENNDRTFWTARAFHGFIQDEYKIECSYPTVVRFLHEQNYALKVPQPWPGKQDEAQRKAFLEELKILHEQEDTDIWFCDESGFEGECRARQRWDKKGHKTRIMRNGSHIRMSVVGLVCPRTGEFMAIEVSHSDSEVFQVFLDEATSYIKPKRKKNSLILDNASWHHHSSLKWNWFEPMFLPPYSPDLNPIERLWLVMKNKWFNNFHAPDYETLIQRLDQALLDLMNNSEQVQSTASMRTYF